MWALKNNYAQKYVTIHTLDCSNIYTLRFFPNTQYLHSTVLPKHTIFTHYGSSQTHNIYTLRFFPNTQYLHSTVLPKHTIFTHYGSSQTHNIYTVRFFPNTQYLHRTVLPKHTIRRKNNHNETFQNLVRSFFFCNGRGTPYGEVGEYYHHHHHHRISHFSSLAGKYSPILGCSNQQD
jgi:hypothetical protein